MEKTIAISCKVGDDRNAINNPNPVLTVRTSMADSLSLHVFVCQHLYKSRVVGFIKLELVELHAVPRPKIPKPAHQHRQPWTDIASSSIPKSSTSKYPSHPIPSHPKRLAIDNPKKTTPSSLPEPIIHRLTFPNPPCPASNSNVLSEINPDGPASA